MNTTSNYEPSGTRVYTPTRYRPTNTTGVFRYKNERIASRLLQEVGLLKCGQEFIWDTGSVRSQILVKNQIIRSRLGLNA